MNLYYVINVNGNYVVTEDQVSYKLRDARLFTEFRDAREIAIFLGYTDFVIERTTILKGKISTPTRIETV